MSSCTYAFKTTSGEEVRIEGKANMIAWLAQNGVEAIARPEVMRSAERQTDTPEFKKWFGDSKVVDANGKPLVVYHGTPGPGDFAEFSMDVGGDGFFFTAKPGRAAQFAQHRATDGAGADEFASGVTVLPVYLSLQNPAQLNAKALRKIARELNQKDIDKFVADFEDSEQVARELVTGYVKSRGHDGMVIARDLMPVVAGGDWGYIRSYVAFRPEQIKSAIGNNGQFDPTNPDIRKSADRSQTETPEFKKWFGDSKVTVSGRAGGKPRLVYHGTEKEFVAFNLGRVSDMREEGGFFFTPDRSRALPYGDRVIEAYLSIKNPFRIDPLTWMAREMENDDGDTVPVPTTAELKAQGYDGVWIDGDETSAGDPDWEFGNDVYIAFYPEQIKSATGNDGSFDDNDPSILSSAARNWYSQLERAIESVPARLDNMSAPMWAQWLKANAAKLGVKQDEVTWSGIEDWLKLKGKDKVSKAEIAEYLAGNGVRVEEVVLGGTDFVGGLHADQSESGSWHVVDDEARVIEGPFDSEEEADAAKAQLLRGAAPTKYSQYTLPGGSNYREVLLTLPERRPLTQAWRAAQEKYGDNDPRTVAAKKAARAEAGPQAAGYKSVHWDQPNILAHIRLNDRTDADGKRVLFVEELQSDWAQDGRKKGFAGDKEEQAFQLLRDDGSSEGVYPTREAAEGRRQQLNGRQFPADRRPLNTASWRVQPVMAILERGVPRAPFIDDTSKWLNLALKRVVKLAVDEGYSRVAFVNGEQSADRYDLSKQVDRIDYDDKTGNLVVTDLDGRKPMTKDGVKPDDLPDIIGKEVADRLMANADTSTGFRYTLQGNGLKVGGEGMKAFYDTIVPQAVNTLLKKVGGGKMEEVAIGSSRLKVQEAPGGDGFVIFDEQTEEFYRGGQSGRPWVDYPRNAKVYLSEASAKKALPQIEGGAAGMQQPGFAITDKIRETAAGGMPLFSREREWGDFPDAVIATPLASQSKDEDYTAAKAGSTVAAARMVSRVLPQSAIDSVRQMIGDLKPTVVPVTSEEATGRNKIPLATATRLADALELPLDISIVQSTRARRTGSDGISRLGVQPEFDGEVKAGADYLLVDDTLTQGGTMAQLKAHIEAGGGRVVGAFALSGKQYSAKLAPDAQTISQLREQYGSIEDWWRDELGYGFAGLTQSEARYILGSGVAPEALRDRVAAARRAAGVGSASGDEARLSRERTETPEFKAWFKDSKVVDEQGRPLVVYHGTANDFSEFDPSLAGRNYFSSGARRGMFFTNNPGTASVYAEQAAGAYLNPAYPENHSFGRGTAQIMPVYLALQNPLVISTKKSPDKFFDGKWEDIMARVNARGHDGVIIRGGAEFKRDLYVVLRPAQIKSAIGNDGSYDESDPSILSSAARNWESVGASKFDDLLQKFQDKHVDLLRTQQAIKETGAEIRNDLDAYLKEELFHGRAAKRTEDFTKKELEPLTKAMADRGLTIEELDEYLHARHAPEANRLVAERNPDSPDLQDGGSGLTNQQAADYMSSLPADKRDHLQAVASQVDKILAKTRDLMVDYELESRDTVKGWGEMFQHYVPLMREDDGGAPARIGTGQGFSIKGREVKSRTGSTKKVVDILANIAMQRERVIVRGEKNRVGQALVNLALENPNDDFWSVDITPRTPTYDPAKGVVVMRPDPMFKMRPNVVVAKFKELDGSVQEHAVVFNEKDARAMRMAASLKNLEAARMEGFLGGAAAVTRYFSAIVTQYNPVFGVINFMRDIQAVMFNLKSTPLDGLQKQIAADSFRAAKQIYSNLRTGKDDGDLQKLWDEFRDVGGQTGFRQLYADSADRADAIREAINPDAWTDTKLGKIFTANGVLKVPMAKAMRASKGLFQWLTDYNDTLENATRLATYKAGKAKFLAEGMPELEAREKAASVAKNITVSFNRRGELGQQIGALYAFFNASMQGTARLAQLLFEMEPGKPKTIRLSRVGKRIVAGGVLLGVAQALALMAAGFSDDDPPEFVRERALVIPTGGKGYISIPMPLGLHVLPNLGRIATEWAFGGFNRTPQRVVGLLGLLSDAFVPTGSSGISMQTLSPTAIDPLVALAENRDWQGRPIAKESMNAAIPGHALVKDTATAWSKWLAEAVNYATGGNHYVRGAVSPTPDQLDYILAAFGGGVAKEISKTQQSVTGFINGEEVPTYKIPFVGRLVGNAASQQSESTAFYSASKKLNELETEIKGLQKDGRFSDANALRAARPDAYLMTQVNRAERDISALRKQKSELVASGAPRERVREIEDKITARMAAFNRAAEALAGRQKAGS